MNDIDVVITFREHGAPNPQTVRDAAGRVRVVVAGTERYGWAALTVQFDDEPDGAEQDTSRAIAMDSFVVVTGDPVDGFRFYGPTPLESDRTDAYTRRLEDIGEDWWQAPLHAVPAITEEPSLTSA